jgi:predicted TIM-barrel fold metal-dependent hydrolase
MTLCQLWDPALAATEIERCAGRGVRAISMPENTVHFGLPSYYSDTWEPIWAACEDADLAVCLHSGTAGNYDAYIPSPESQRAVYVTLAGAAMPQAALLNLLFSPVCTRFPRLKVVFSEAGIGWLPSALERADLVWERYRDTQELPIERPSEIWERNLYVCQVQEEVGFRLLDVIGNDKVLWELDYPHPDTMWPCAQAYTEGVFAAAGVSSDDAERITHRNAEALFRWTPAA